MVLQRNQTTDKDRPPRRPRGEFEETEGKPRMRAKVWDGIREVFDNGLSSQEIKNKYNQIYTTYKKELTNSEGLEQVNVCGNIGIFLMPYFRESPRKEWRIVLLMSWAVAKICH